MRKEELLVNLSKSFAIHVIQVCSQMRERHKELVIINQLLRSGTSIGANIHEGNYASSRMNFINKFQIALKECYETEYWLDIFKETEYLFLEEYDALSQECSKIRNKLVHSITTAKSNV